MKFLRNPQVPSAQNDVRFGSLADIERHASIFRFAREADILFPEAAQRRFNAEAVGLVGAAPNLDR